jgi:hypothetical protein
MCNSFCSSGLIMKLSKAYWINNGLVGDKKAIRIAQKEVP